MMSDRTGGPDGSYPFRPWFHTPARLGIISTGWYNPHGVRMYWRGKYNNGVESTSFPAWTDTENITAGRLTGFGGTVTNGRTMILDYEIDGRVPPHTWVYTILKISGGTPTRTVHSLVITGAGAYSISFTAPAGGSATIEGGSNREEFLLDDS